MEYAFAIGAPVGVCAEVIALGLGEIGRQTFTAIGIKICQGSRYCKHGDAQADSRLQHFPPRRLMVKHNSAESLIEQKVGQFRIAFKRRSNVVQQPGTDNAACPPNASNSRVIQIIVVFLRRQFEQSKTLGIGGDLTGI